jgi:methionyl-tRNA synthetase
MIPFDARMQSLRAFFEGVIKSLRIIAILITPVLPKAAYGIFDQLNWKMELSGKEERFSLKDAEWGGIAGRTRGRQSSAIVPADR